jgi:preprotein translocase subunit SecA
MRMFGSERIAKVMDFAGYKEGEVIQHSMITKSIERAQKKVEENNFGIRKRLLEYDDVMNKQRTVIYTKRNHALFGERLALDLDNAFYDVAESLVINFTENTDYEGFKLEVIVNFGIDTTISKEEFDKADVANLAYKLYDEALTHYQAQRIEIGKRVVPIFQNIRKAQGAHIVNVAVPFSDGKRGMQILSNLEKTIESTGIELMHNLEKTITLSFIDDAWKEHLREMDDLKRSVHTAHYEQKDPLVIYKQEAFMLFSRMNGAVNKEIVNFLCHADIPVEQGQGAPQQIREGREQRTDMSNLRSNKVKLDTAGRPIASDETHYETPEEKLMPIKTGPKTGRNDPCPCGSGKKYKQCHGKEA